jgi:hypothetical protein
MTQKKASPPVMNLEVQRMVLIAPTKDSACRPGAGRQYDALVVVWVLEDGSNGLPICWGFFD